MDNEAAALSPNFKNWRRVTDVPSEESRGREDHVSFILHVCAILMSVKCSFKTSLRLKNNLS